MQKKSIFSMIYNLPIAIWMTIFFGLPTLIIILFSFLKRSAYGGVQKPYVYTLDSYKLIFTDKNIWEVTLRTINISIWVTILTVFFALPTAYFISRSKHKSLLLLLIVIPFWTNMLIRIFSFIAILGNNGIVNKVLMKIFMLKDPLPLMYNKTAVIIISAYVLLPYAILPLYSSIEKFDFSLLDAAADLGANKYQALFKVFLPGIKGGIITATLFTFVPAIGSYAIPDLVGGTDGLMLGNMIADRMLKLHDWPTAAAMSTLFIIITTIGLIISAVSLKGDE